MCGLSAFSLLFKMTLTPFMRSRGTAQMTLWSNPIQNDGRAASIPTSQDQLLAEGLEELTELGFRRLFKKTIFKK